MPLTEGDKLRAQEKVRAALQEARRSRYPAVLVLAQGEEIAPDLWRNFAQANGLAVLDMLEAAQDPVHRQSLSAWPALVDWIRQQAVVAGGLLILDLDVVATKWGDDSRRRLFWKLLKSETRTQEGRDPAPIVAVSALASGHDLPTDKRSYGCVLALHD